MTTASIAHAFYDPTVGRFLSMDPIDDNKDESPYTYVGGDPVNKVDPDGRDAVFTLTNGTKKTVITAKDFVDIARKATPGTITNITFVQAHGNSTSQGIGRGSTTDQEITFEDGNVYVEADYGATKQEIGSLLKNKMAPNGYIWYTGCDTADGGVGSLTFETSIRLPNAQITGSTFPSYPTFDDNINFFIHEKTYLDGKVIDSNWFSTKRRSDDGKTKPACNQ